MQKLYIMLGYRLRKSNDSHGVKKSYWFCTENIQKILLLFFTQPFNFLKNFIFFEISKHYMVFILFLLNNY